MIRDFSIEDTEKLYVFIKKMDPGYEMDGVLNIEENARKFIVYVLEKNIVGLAYATKSINDANELEMEISIYVEPQKRMSGIGTALFKKIESYLVDLEPDILSTYVRVDINDSGEFFNKMGFHKWWGSPELIYKGNTFTNVDIDLITYDDEHFEQFVKVVQESYYELHKTNDLKPYLVSPDMVSTYKLNHKENVYVALKNEQIVASVTIGKGTIDNLMVSPAYQGMGYGKEALQFGMNELLNRGFHEIRICYMEGNTAAEKLYLALGFKPLKNTHVYRKLIN